MKCAVLTDSTCDLNEAQAEVLGIHIVPLNIHFDGHDWLDHHELRSSELFRRVQAGAVLPSTSPPAAALYREKLEELLEKHDHVLAVHLSGGLSQTAEQAEKLALDYPSRVTVVDSWNSTAALAMQANRAAQLVKEGVPPEQIKEVLLSLRPHVHTHMCLSTLAYLRKNGRIGGAAALIGGFLHLKPVVGLKEGKVEAYGRALGRGQALRLMTGLLEKYARETPNGRVSFFHNGSEDSVGELRDVARRLLLQNPFNLELGTVLSAHGGPGVYGFSYEPVQVWQDFRAY